MDIIGGIGIFVLLFLGLALLTIAWKTIKIVPQSSVLLIERLGKFHRVAQSGLNIIVPFFEAPRAVYWTNVRPGLTSTSPACAAVSPSIPSTPRRSSPSR